MQMAIICLAQGCDLDMDFEPLALNNNVLTILLACFPSLNFNVNIFYMCINNIFFTATFVC